MTQTKTKTRTKTQTKTKTKARTKTETEKEKEKEKDRDRDRDKDKDKDKDRQRQKVLCLFTMESYSYPPCNKLLVAENQRQHHPVVCASTRRESNRNVQTQEAPGQDSPLSINRRREVSGFGCVADSYRTAWCGLCHHCNYISGVRVPTEVCSVLINT